MFDFVGKVMVLQPEADASFVARSERPHPMLPPQPGLFVLREPTAMSTVAGGAGCCRACCYLCKQGSHWWRQPGGVQQVAVCLLASSAAVTDCLVPHAALCLVAATLQQDAGFVRDAVNQAISNLPAAVAAAAAGPDGIVTPPPAAAAAVALAPASAPKAASKAGGGGSKGAGKAPKARPPVRSAREAALELMNVPHPLDILADAGAYGTDGAISRYHNPDNCEFGRNCWVAGVAGLRGGGCGMCRAEACRFWTCLGLHSSPACSMLHCPLLVAV